MNTENGLKSKTSNESKIVNDINEIGNGFLDLRTAAISEQIKSWINQLDGIFLAIQGSGWYNEVVILCDTEIANESNYNSLVEFLNLLVDEIGESEIHPLLKILEIVTKRVSEYEYKCYRMDSPVTDANLLKFLMDQHSLKQTDLSELGSQDAISDLLNGKLQLDRRQIGVICKRFSISTDTFFNLGEI